MKKLLSFVAAFVLLVGLLMVDIPAASANVLPPTMIVDHVNVISVGVGSISLDAIYSTKYCYGRKARVSYNVHVAQARVYFPADLPPTIPISEWQDCSGQWIPIRITFGGPFETGKRTVRVTDDVKTFNIQVKVTEPKSKRK